MSPSDLHGTVQHATSANDPSEREWVHIMSKRILPFHSLFQSPSKFRTQKRPIRYCARCLACIMLLGCRNDVVMSIKPGESKVLIRTGALHMVDTALPGTAFFPKSKRWRRSPVAADVTGVVQMQSIMRVQKPTLNAACEFFSAH